MKRLTITISLIALSALACSIAGVGLAPTDAPAPTAEMPTPTTQQMPTLTPAPPPPTEPASISEQRCGDGVCDGPENPENCSDDCQPVGEPEAVETPLTDEAGPQEVDEASATVLPATVGDRLLYQLVEHSVTINEMNGTECTMFSFRRFLDAGTVEMDDSDPQPLDLKDNPTSKVTAQAMNAYYYISTPNDPVTSLYGMEIFDWDAEEQTLWSAGFEGGAPQSVVASEGETFPGGVAAAPENRHLLYLQTTRAGDDSSQPGGAMVGKFNPFLSDSSLLAVNNEGADTLLLDGNYNRQLFTSFDDFSPGGDYFYTIARADDGFDFIRADLETGQVERFAEVFPEFDWEQTPWDAFFPPANDFSYASFTISPDETRLIAYKSRFVVLMDNPCFSEALHDVWVFDIEGNTIERFADRPGYVADADWRPDSSQVALAIVAISGCYPDYLDSGIDALDREGKVVATLSQEPKSKMTTLGWSSDGQRLAYDVYGTDFVGRVKVVDMTDGSVREIVNTETLGFAVNRATPVTLLFADWVSRR